MATPTLPQLKSYTRATESDIRIPHWLPLLSSLQ